MEMQNEFDKIQKAKEIAQLKKDEEQKITIADLVEAISDVGTEDLQPSTDIELANNIWTKLSERRLSRGKKS